MKVTEQDSTGAACNFCTTRTAKTVYEIEQDSGKGLVVRICPPCLNELVDKTILKDS